MNTGRLAEGLKNYDLTIEEVQNGQWFYCGGDHDDHLNYWKMRNNTKQLMGKKEWSFPPHESHCACGHFIKNNCYITNKKKILVVGNCCIKRFLLKKSRVCEVCTADHKNRKYNLCDECKPKFDIYEWDKKEKIKNIISKYNGQTREECHHERIGNDVK